MKKSLYQLLLLALIITALCSCNNNELNGKSYYLLTGNVNYNNSYAYASLKEMKLNFITNDKVEAKMTLYADAFGYRIINDTSAETESKIYSYKYENGILELPDLHLMAKLEFLSNGNIKTNEGEYFYTNSIVDLLGTDKAYERLKEDSKGNYAAIFKDYLKSEAKPLIRREGGTLYLNNGNAEISETERDKIKKEYNSIVAENSDIFQDVKLQGKLGEEQQIIIKIKDLIKAHLNDNSYADILMNNLVQSLKSKIEEFKEHANQLKDENEKLNRNLKDDSLSSY